MEFDARGHIDTRKERLHRCLDVVVILKETGRDSTLIQLDFVPRTEGVNFYACDSAIPALLDIVDNQPGSLQAQSHQPDVR